ncbi:hypothetical protein ASE23_27680 [Rhizobium sp. Root73]|uniref:RloB domain-containing protein n=1 Tax=unclassified Rhizobium TaxID=2613769 RepID=UPI0007274F53|nr:MULTISPECIES: RloB domain-containing protein [unclassified Rhizobium]KQY13630.1 hypothetical protein ASD36_26870 [Rhizobium sp. Root1334]KRC06048.1 hypothetical protein ASE23_27680 [Rhizobium sp. Root73]
MKIRITIPQRKRIFLGCEGESEQSYGALLARIVGQQKTDFFLDTVLLRPGGGDPLALVELAEKKKKQGVKKGGDYAAAYVLMDTDKRGQAPLRDQQALKLAQDAGLTIIWQQPCHEALLLRHLPNAQQLQPQSTALALTALTAKWATYTKGMPAAKLAVTINADGLRRVRTVELSLDALLTDLGFE